MVRGARIRTIVDEDDRAAGHSIQGARLTKKDGANADFCTTRERPAHRL